MGQRAAETVKEIEVIRARLGSDLGELESRLPSPALWAKRLAGLAVGGGVGASLLWSLVRRSSGRNKATETPAPIVHVVPERVAKAMAEMPAPKGGRFRPWMAAVAGAWLLFRLAELRELRRLNQEPGEGR